MRLLRSGRLAALVATAAAAAVPTSAVAADPPVSAVVGTTSPRAAHALTKELRADGLKVSSIPRIDVLKVSGEAFEGVRARVAGDERVDWVEAPQSWRLLAAGGGGSDGLVAATPTALAVPQMDALSGRPSDWFADLIRAPEGLALAPATLPVRVAVVDSGLDVNHPDLRGRVAPGDSVLSTTTGVTDKVGHGTFVAGLVSGIEGNGIGGRGVAGSTIVVPIKVTDSMSITSENVAAGIVRAVDSEGVGVINLSFGGQNVSPAVQAALAYAAEKDVLVVAAAGNSHNTGNAPLHPAVDIGGVRGGWSSGLSVAATTPSGRRASASTTNDGVSVAAPAAGNGACGDGVLSTIPSNLTQLWDPAVAPLCVARVFGLVSSPTGRYAVGDGTSFAAPLVAGTAALVRDTNPNLSAEQTADVIRRTARQTVGSGWNPETGAGVIDVKNAVTLARVYDTVEPEAALAVAPVPGAVSVSLGARDVTEPADALAGVASYRLEASSDGGVWSEVVAPQSTPITFTDTPAPGQRRWFRGSVCDMNHNCTTTAATGPFIPRSATPVTKTKAAAARVRSSLFTLTRTCRTCLTVTFSATASDGSTLRWLIPRQKAAGAEIGSARGTVPSRGRVTARIRLSRLPLCRTRLPLTITLTSPTGTRRLTRAITVSGSCRTHSRR